MANSAGKNLTPLFVGGKIVTLPKPNQSVSQFPLANCEEWALDYRLIIFKLHEITVKSLLAYTIDEPRQQHPCGEKLFLITGNNYTGFARTFKALQSPQILK